MSYCVETNPKTCQLPIPNATKQRAFENAPKIVPLTRIGYGSELCFYPRATTLLTGTEQSTSVIEEYPRLVQFLNHLFSERYLGESDVTELVAILNTGVKERHCSNSVMQCLLDRIILKAESSAISYIQPVLTEFKTRGMKADYRNIGYFDFSKRNYLRGTNDPYLIYECREPLVFWELPVNTLTAPLKQVVLNVGTTLAELACVGLANEYCRTNFYPDEILEAWDLEEETIIELGEALTNGKSAPLYDKVEAIVGVDAMSEALDIIENMYGYIEADEFDDDGERKAALEEYFVEIINVAMTTRVGSERGVLLNGDDMWGLLWHLHSLRCNPHSQCDSVITSLINVVEILLKFTIDVDYDFTLISDMRSLEAQHLLCFDSVQENEYLANCIDSTGNYFMETGESAQALIEDSPAFRARFRNMHMGWFLLSYLEDVLFNATDKPTP